MALLLERTEGITYSGFMYVSKVLGFPFSFPLTMESKTATASHWLFTQREVRQFASGHGSNQDFKSVGFPGLYSFNFIFPLA